MKKRVFSFLMAAMILFSAVPAEAFAAGSSEADELYFIDDTIWLAEGEEPSAPVVETGKWVKTEETKTASVLCCSEEEHTHLQNCPVADDGSFACGGHIHTDSCYAKVYDHDAHTHTEECSSDPACTLQEHIHTDECAFVLGELTCGQAEHTHVTNGCEADCALAEHSHGEACQQTVTLVKWVVELNEDVITTYAELGMPVHFFVTTLEQAQNPRGSYTNYKQTYWGKQNGASTNDTQGAYAVANITSDSSWNVINSQQGIRANMAEEEILKYIAQWPDGGTADDFRKFTGNLRVGSTSYSGDDYEVQWVTICYRNDSYSNWRACNCSNARYDHIHIDGILTKKIKITPGTVSLTKQISAAQSEDQTFNFKLYQLALDSSYKPTDTTIGSGIDMVATIPAGSTTAQITTKDSNVELGFGYYKLVEQPNEKWLQNSIKMGNKTTNTSGALYICIHTDGSVQYSTSYASSYQTVSGASIINTPLPTKDITVSKVWDDNNDQDGIRPDSVTVHLLRNNQHYGEGKALTLSAANNWTAAWQDVPAADSQGNAYSFHVEEVVPEGYTGIVSGSADSGFTITNTHAPEKTSVEVHKIWEDDENRDGLRPDSVTVQLYRQVGENGTKTAVGSPVSIAAANYWTYEWDELDAHSNGTPIIYSVKETQVSGYNEPRYTTDEHTGRLVITNSRDVGKINVAVNKVWNDQNNRDGIRPDKVSVTLYANGIRLTSAGTTVELSAANGWSHTWTGLYEYYHGKKIAYTVAEAVPNGYTAVTTGNASTGYTITNTHTPETISVPVNKVWDDGDNQDGIRPASVEVKLLADGQATDETLTLNAANNWAGSFDDMPKYKAGAVKQAITYTVEENAVTDYTATVTGDAEIGYTVTNSHTPMVATLTVNKVWNDANDQDGKRPEEVTVTLYANGHPLMKGANGPDFAAATGTPYTLILSNNNNWTGSWQNMPRYHNGQRVSYTVVETGHDGQPGLPAGYTVTHQYAGTDTTNGTATITNSYTPEQTSINVQKVWDDEDNRDGKRPNSVEVKLMRSISKDDNGENIWEDVSDETDAVVKATLNPDNEWEHVFTGLPKYYNGTEILYNVVETTNDANYLKAEYAYDPATGVVTVTNKRTVERTSVSVTKAWDDAENQDGIRPESVNVTLYANGYKLTAEGTTVELSADNDWSYTWDDLYKNYHGKEVVYTVAEAVPNGYTAVTTGNASTGYTITNTHEVEKVDIPVSKTWADNNNQDGIRPEAVEVTLYADGAATSNTVVLSAANNWQAVFTGLDKNKTKQSADTNTAAIAYTVVESGHYDKYDPTAANNTKDDEAIPEGYNVTYNGTAITNTHTPETTSITAVKIWRDSENQDGDRPASIKLHLLANGRHMNEQYPDQGYMVTLTEDAKQENGTWQYTWTGLPKYAEAKEINYTVEEEPITGGEYSTSYYRAEKDKIEITNTKAPDKTTFTVQKVWVDANNQDAIRPAGVMVQLYANGTESGDPIKLSLDGNNWRYSWTDLNKNDNGQAINYTVAELYYVDANGDKIEDESVCNAYTKTTETDTHTGVVHLVNTHVPETTSVSVTKEWKDEDNRDGIRPASVQVTLYRNGENTGETLTLNAANKWTGKFENLDVHHGIGIDNVYTVAEAVPNGYTAVTTGNASTSYTITNTHTPETISVPVNKVWDDGDNQDGIRPDSVTVNLLADNVDTGKTLTLNAAGNWAGQFDNMPKYKTGEVGQAITYTVVETSVPEGYTVSYNGTTVTNSHTPMVATLSVNKVWNDVNDQDGKRPTSVEVTLYANGHPLMKGANGPDFAAATGTPYTLILSNNNNWTGSWMDMPRYHNGQRVSYTVVETSHDGQPGLPAGYTVTHQYAGTDTTNGTATITNSYTPEQTSINVQKVWDDEDNRDGKRPESVTVTLQRKVGNGNWEATDQTAVLNPANEWDHDFTGLPKYSGGQPISYNVVEASVEGYQAPVYSELDANGVITITNKRAADKVSVSVTKAWDDAENQDGIRPESVNVTLYANGYKLTAEGTTVTLGEHNNWTYTWTNLYKNYHGNEIVYTVAEAVPNGYTAVTTGNASTGYTITNTHEVEKVDIPVSKAWEDEDNRDGIRPEAVEVTLYADGEATERTLILSMHNNWQAVFTGLDKYRLTNGASQPITYTVIESGHYDKYDPAADDEHNVRSGGVPEGYTPAYNGYTITNTHAVELTAFTVVKQWDDDGNRDGKRPASIKLHLLANGIHMNEQFPGKGYMVSLTSAAQQPDTWQYTWKDLYKNRGGQAIRYTVYEEPIYPADSSTNTVDANGEPIAPQAATLYTTTYVRNSDTQDTVINTYVPETVAVTVTKIWDDGNDRDGLRPESITVTLCGDGTAAETATLNAANNWSYSWTALPKYKDGGTPIVYTVQEPAVPEGYTCAIKKDHGADAANGNAVPNYHYFVMTNTHVPETTSVSVTKKWNDDDNNDGKRPDGLIVQLFADGSEVPNGMAVLSAINNWSYTWPADMPLYVYKTTWDDTGAKSTGNIRYSVREIGYVMGSTEYTGLPDGYTGTDIMEGFNVTLTNTRESEKVSVEVSKVWDDGNDRDAIRPASVQVTLKKNDTAVETVTLDASNGWAYKWDNLKRYDGGAIADYTVEEAAVESYTVSYSKAADASGNVTVTITNTHEPATNGGGGGGDSSITKTVIVSKVWEDNSNIEGLRPERVVLRLYKNGKAYGDKIVLSDANCWNKAVTLPVYEDGDKIQWTVRELKIPRYYSVSYNQRSLTVTNTLQSKTIPKTGDTSNLMLWLLLMGVCGAGMGAVLLLNNKKKRYRR